MVSAAQKKALHSILASKLNKLTIPSSSSSMEEEFEFSDVFGPQTPSAGTSSSQVGVGNGKDPEVIHHRSHSFVGPSPRYVLSKSLPLSKETDCVLSESEEKEEGGGEGLERKDGEAGSGKEEIAARIGPGDFEILRVVGQGAFGKVFQVRKKGVDMDAVGVVAGDGDGIYAMKVMRKETIIKKNHVDYMRAERDILTKVEHPFIVQLRYSFQTKSKLYLILDFINGGHLFYHLYRQGIFSEDQARLYAAEIVSAVSHLHERGIVHRDLKPENILMTPDGHVMLTDFGLAKEIDESSRSNSLCGTTEYMAPEILLSKGHNKNADWWSVGILLFEMLTGQVEQYNLSAKLLENNVIKDFPGFWLYRKRNIPIMEVFGSITPPFTHANRQKLQQRIINEKVKLPPFLTSEAHSLLKGLLEKDPTKRLGSGPKGAYEIKSHKWFKLINWKKLEAKELLPKFIPEVSGNECTANFDRCWTTMPPNDSPAGTPSAGEHFQGYTYVPPNPWLSSSTAGSI